MFDNGELSIEDKPRSGRQSPSRTDVKTVAESLTSSVRCLEYNGVHLRGFYPKTHEKDCNQICVVHAELVPRDETVNQKFYLEV